MDINTKSAKISTLKNDDTFKDVMTEVKDQQISVFLNTLSSDEDRGKAHNVVCALEQIMDYMQSVIDDAKIQEKRNK
ncbi:MAG: hypothetical protein HOE82_11975 [Gammaproteobacteria bacterium]|nr:hypothetical protein [Gammaproteobacteria bacterium]